MVLRTGTFSGGWATDLYAASADLLGGNDPGDDEIFISRIKLQSRLSMELKKKNWIQNGSQTQFWLLWVQRHLALP